MLCSIGNLATVWRPQWTVLADYSKSTEIEKKKNATLGRKIYGIETLCSLIVHIILAILTLLLKTYILETDNQRGEIIQSYIGVTFSVIGLIVTQVYIHCFEGWLFIAPDDECTSMELKEFINDAEKMTIPDKGHVHKTDKGRKTVCQKIAILTILIISFSMVLAPVYLISRSLSNGKSCEYSYRLG